MRMDLDPEIEAGNRKTENEKLDLLDEKQVKPIVDMMNAGILTVEAAQAMLGIEPGRSTDAPRVVWGVRAALSAS
jgi:hypothetical protein